MSSLILAPHLGRWEGSKGKWQDVIGKGAKTKYGHVEIWAFHWIETGRSDQASMGEYNVYKFRGLAVSNWQDLWMGELIHCQWGILEDMIKMVVSQGRLWSYGEEFDNILACLGSALINSTWGWSAIWGKHSTIQKYQMLPMIVNQPRRCEL